MTLVSSGETPTVVDVCSTVSIYVVAIVVECFSSVDVASIEVKAGSEVDWSPMAVVERISVFIVVSSECIGLLY